MSKKYIIVISIAACLMALYLLAFHGEFYSYVNYEDNGRLYTRTQHLFNIPISQKEWLWPEDAPSKPVDSYSLSSKNSWRGFGLLWKITVHYD